MAVVEIGCCLCWDTLEIKVEMEDSVFLFKLPKGGSIMFSFSKRDLIALSFKLLKWTLLSQQKLNFTFF